MNAALISGLIVVLAGVIMQNAWYYWRRRWQQWTAGALELAGSLLVGWGADMARKSITVVLVGAALVLAVAGSLAFVAFMAEVKRQGWMSVVKRMSERRAKRS